MIVACENCIGVCCVAGGAINVTPEDKQRLAAHLGINVYEFDAGYITTENGTEIVKRHYDPCPFLKEGKCSVHVARPEVCREYFCWNRQDLSYGIAERLQQGGVVSGTLKIHEKPPDGIDVELIAPRYR